VATLVARNPNDAVVVPMVGSGGISFGRSLESGGWFCVGAFGRNLASVVMMFFSHLIHFLKSCINIVVIIIIIIVIII
jgi:hypothetical protein